MIYNCYFTISIGQGRPFLIEWLLWVNHWSGGFATRKVSDANHWYNFFFIKIAAVAEQNPHESSPMPHCVDLRSFETMSISWPPITWRLASLGLWHAWYCKTRLYIIYAPKPFQCDMIKNANAYSLFLTQISTQSVEIKFRWVVVIIRCNHFLWRIQHLHWIAFCAFWK